MPSSPAIHGYCDSQFSHVKQVFADNFVERGEVGAGVALFHGGRNVVNLWAGRKRPLGFAPWEQDTLVNIYSGTKGITAIAALQLVSRGLLDLDKPVAYYWPQFARHDKSTIPVKWILSHKAGVVGVSRPLLGRSLYRWRTMSNALANQAPWWNPGEGHGYHAVSYGWIMGEIIKAITGKTVGQYLRSEIAQPLGLDLHIGLPAGHHHRVAPIMLPLRLPESEHTWNLIGATLKDPFGPSTSALLNPLTIATGVNSQAWRSSELPAANAHSTAFALAKLYGALAIGGTLDKVEIINASTLPLAINEASCGHDYVLKMDTRFSMGFMLNQHYPAARFGPGLRSFGHNGAGGSFAFADPDAELGFGYVMNRMGTYLLMDPRAQHLIDAAYKCL